MENPRDRDPSYSNATRQQNSFPYTLEFENEIDQEEIVEDNSFNGSFQKIGQLSPQKNQYFDQSNANGMGDEEIEASPPRISAVIDENPDRSIEKVGQTENKKRVKFFSVLHKSTTYTSKENFPTSNATSCRNIPKLIWQIVFESRQQW
jgi:hypothetical protein